MSLQFHSTDLSRIEISTLDYLIHKIKHDLAILVISGTKTDALADWCQCRDRKTGAYIPLVIWKYYHQAMHFFKIGAFDSKKNDPTIFDKYAGSESLDTEATCRTG